MPFPAQSPHPFTREHVETLQPGEIGCYGLFHHDRCVYVGKGDIRNRLLKHLEGDNGCILMGCPTHWFAVVCAEPEGRERELLLELQPLCNQRVS